VILFLKSILIDSSSSDLVGYNSFAEQLTRVALERARIQLDVVVKDVSSFKWMIVIAHKIWDRNGT